jgi:DNA gyrase/topoisomerase IV subunit A
MEVFIVTKKGLGKRMDVEQFRPMGRGARGITTIALEGDDEVVAVIEVKNNISLKDNQV